MSNKLINAVIALIENRPVAARDLLRSPELNNISIGEVSARLWKAIDKAKALAAKEALQRVLQESIRMGHGLDIKDDQIYRASQEGFVGGIIAVETIVEKHLGELESLD